MNTQACFLNKGFPVQFLTMVRVDAPEKSERVMKALLNMKKKIDMEELRRAYEGAF